MKAKLEHNSFKDFAVQASNITDKFNFQHSYKDNKDFFLKSFCVGLQLISAASRSESV